MHILFLSSLSWYYVANLLQNSAEGWAINILELFYGQIWTLLSSLQFLPLSFAYLELTNPCKPSHPSFICSLLELSLFFFPNFHLLIWERERLICRFTYLCIHWLILLCALIRDRTCNLGVLEDTPTNWAMRPAPGAQSWVAPSIYVYQVTILLLY